MSLAGNTNTSTQDVPLVIGGSPETRHETLLSGEDLAAGTVVGRVTASGKLVESEQDAVNGSQNPIGVLLHDVDASGGDADCQIIIGGQLNAAALVWHSSWDSQAKKDIAFDRTAINVVELNA